jgi:hypothetical protein
MSTPQGVFEVKCSIRNNDLATSRGSQLQNMGMHREKWCYLTMNNGGLTMKNVVLIKKNQPMNTGCGMMWALKMVC